ncbi:DUF6160 family protein [Marinobacter caseinilyticus]|uniref:DUF6160 family protein n=1 Tax=Marinobacter caseinilyticus TaxID=2692195 RepID=UPI0014080F1A|nr:DUF6160 family protein [Marinobacter caseinilyticus]
MKGLKKLALATAVAAVPFAAQADLRAMDDSAMGNVTGQAGVTIELETRVSIGEFRYTDTGAGPKDGGSFAVSGIELGGAGLLTGAAPIFDTDGDGAPDLAATQLLDDLAIDIDLNAEGDALISVHTISGLPIDWAFTADAMTLEGTDSTTLISGMSAWGFLAQLDITVDTADKGTGDGSLNIAAAFTVQDMDFDVPFLAVGIRDMSITGAGTNFDYNGDGVVDAADVDLDGSGTVGDTTAERINVGFASVNMDIYKGAGLGASTATDVLRIDVNDIVMDVNVGDVLVGGSTIGSISMDNLHISNTKLAVYGH